MQNSSQREKKPTINVGDKETDFAVETKNQWVVLQANLGKESEELNEDGKY